MGAPGGAPPRGPSPGVVPGGWGGPPLWRIGPRPESDTRAFPRTYRLVDIPYLIGHPIGELPTGENQRNLPETLGLLELTRGEAPPGVGQHGARTGARGARGANAPPQDTTLSAPRQGPPSRGPSLED